MNILLIEDNVDSAEMLRDVLALNGHQVAVAHDGTAGVSMAAEGTLDVVLCDLGLPGQLSGYEVATRLREDERTAGLALVALTGYGQPEDRARSREAGFDAHVVKPVDPTELAKVLVTVVDGRRDRD